MADCHAVALPCRPGGGADATLNITTVVYAAEGLLERVGTYAFGGILPESVVFDNSSRFLAVTSFDHYDGQTPRGSIDVLRLAGDYFDPKRVELVKTHYSVPVTRGVHSMVIVR